MDIHSCVGWAYGTLSLNVERSKLHINDQILLNNSLTDNSFDFKYFNSPPEYGPKKTKIIRKSETCISTNEPLWHEMHSPSIPGHRALISPKRLILIFLPDTNKFPGTIVRLIPVTLLQKRSPPLHLGFSRRLFKCNTTMQNKMKKKKMKYSWSPIVREWAVNLMWLDRGFNGC